MPMLAVDKIQQSIAQNLDKNMRYGEDSDDGPDSNPVIFASSKAEPDMNKSIANQMSGKASVGPSVEIGGD